MKKFRMYIFSLWVCAFFVLPAWGAVSKVNVKVEGMSCSLCAVSLRRNLQKLSGVKTVDVQLKQQTAVVIPKEGETLDPKAIWDGVIHSGFTPKELHLEVQGLLTHLRGQLALRSERLNQLFFLVDPEGKVKPFLKETGKEILVKGKIEFRKTEEIPTIVITEIQG